MEKPSGYMIIGATTDQFFMAAEHIFKRHKLQPLFWSAPQEYKSKISLSFPNTDFLNHYIFVKADLVQLMINLKYKSKSIFEALSKNWLEEFADKRLIVIENMLHRMDPGGNFTLQEISETVNNYFIMAKLLLDKYRPKLIIFPDAPHLPFDLCLYFLAKKRNIKVFFITNTHIENVSFVGDTITGPHNFFSLHSSRKSGEIEKKCLVENAFDDCGKEKPFYMIEGKGYLAFKKFERRFIEILIDILIGILKYIYIGFIGVLKKFGFLKNKRINIKYSKIKNKRLWEKTGRNFFIFRHLLLNSLFEITYKNLSKKFSEKLQKNNGKKILYIPLSLQKERTTMPCAGFLYDQKIYIKQILEVIPNDWIMIVKENPKQFRHNTGIPARNINFYKDLSNPKIIFAPLDFPSNTLMEKSDLVALTTGTAGFESIIGFSTPIIQFADSWYTEYLPGIKKINDLSSLINAFDNIKETKIDSKKIRYAQKRIIDDSLFLTFAPVKDKTHEEHMARNLFEIWSAIINE